MIDPSIAVKWVIPEVLSDEADRVRDGEADVLAPDLLLVEVANALWKKAAAKEISPREADAAFDLVKRSGIDLRPTGPLLPRAMDAVDPQSPGLGRGAGSEILRSGRSRDRRSLGMSSLTPFPTGRRRVESPCRPGGATSSEIRGRTSRP